MTIFDQSAEAFFQEFFYLLPMVMAFGEGSAAVCSSRVELSWPSERFCRQEYLPTEFW